MRARKSGWRELMWVGLSAFGLLSAFSQCGGKAVVDEGGGTTTTGTTTTGSPTGTTSTGATSTGTTTTGSPTGTTTTTTSTTTITGTECEIACADLFDCTQEGDLCPGLGAGDEPWFIPQCIETCEDIPAMIALIDPDDCPGTVQTLAAVDSFFATVCYGVDSGS